jgi:pimeloyl-ACP methyl ester carboxylesterase
MATFVLVHGSWHGAWCWHRVVPELEALGHRVLAPDLPGHGDDATPLAQLTLAAYAESVASVIRGTTEAVVLVGHSFAGIVISQVAELIPERISRLVYLAAFLPANGQSLSRLATADRDNPVATSSILSADQQLIRLDLDKVQTLLYTDCPDSDIALARQRLCAEPVTPFVTPVAITAGRAGSIPRSYIECLNDIAIPLWFQRQMQAGMPCDPVHALPTGHSPFFSTPTALARLLADTAP